jgi:CBS domain-containing protein
MLVRDVMTKGAECVRPTDSLQQAASKMKDLDVGSLPVCEGDHLVGMITDRDITVRATAEALPSGLGRVRDVMTPAVVSCFEDEDVREAARLMQEHQVRRLVVLNRDRRLAGIVSLGDLAVETGDEKLAGETLEQVSEPASPQADRRLTNQPAHANSVDPEAQASQPVGKDQPGGAQHRLQDVLPEVKDVAQKVGGFKQLAEIAETLDRPKE